MRIVSRVREVLEVDMDAQIIVDAQTIDALAPVVDSTLDTAIDISTLHTAARRRFSGGDTDE